MGIQFDDGQSGGDGGSGGKNFVNWHAQQTKDNKIKSESFSMRDEDKNRVDITPMFVKGVAFLLSGLKTGWTFSNGTPGVSPQWMWNESPAKFDIPEPPPINNQKWKKGFVLPLAIDKDTAGVWQQGGAGAWKGLINLMRAVQDDGGDGEVAVLAMQEEVERISFKMGSTSSPTWKFMKWSKAPACLKEADDEF
jgi:hypothetical protein